MPEVDPIAEAKLLGKMAALNDYMEMIEAKIDPTKKRDLDARMKRDREAVATAPDKTEEQKIAWLDAYAEQMNELAKDKWFVNVNGQIFETEDRQTVVDWINQGRVLKNTPLMDPQSDDWRPASAVFSPWPKASGCLSGLIMFFNLVR